MHVCGFCTHIDRFKIPSTKQICLIEYELIYSPDVQNDRENQMQELIDGHSVNAIPSAAESDRNQNKSMCQSNRVKENDRH